MLVEASGSESDPSEYGGRSPNSFGKMDKCLWT